MGIIDSFKNISILYVEDSKTIRDIMFYKLDGIFNKIYLASNGDEALELLQKYEDEIDIVITDLVMPVLDGPSMIKAIRESLNPIPIIVTTGNSDLMKLDSIIKYHIEGFLTKPIDISRLLNRVSAIVKSLYEKRELQTKKEMIENDIIYAETNEMGVITYVSKPFEKICGYTKEELIGKTFTILKSGQNSTLTYTELWSNLFNAEQWSGELINRAKDGSFYTVSCVISPLYFRKKLIGYSSTSIDITPIKKVSKELESLSRHAAMGEMVSMIAHQWRQPITTIGMIVNNINFDLLMGELQDDLLQKNLNSIETQVQYLSTTIEIFRNFLKKDKREEEFFMNELFDALIKLIKDELNDKGVTLNLKNSIKKYKYSTYKDELIQAMLNITMNAKDALLEQKIDCPTIAIVCYEDDKTIFIDICDNGVGISEENMSKIFTPYFSTKDSKNGTGLGLYMTKTIIEESLDGNISVKKSQMGGAMFSIELPKSFRRFKNG